MKKLLENVFFLFFFSWAALWSLSLFWSSHGRGEVPRTIKTNRKGNAQQRKILCKKSLSLFFKIISIFNDIVNKIWHRASWPVKPPLLYRPEWIFPPVRERTWVIAHDTKNKRTEHALNNIFSILKKNVFIICLGEEKNHRPGRHE